MHRRKLVIGAVVIVLGIVTIGLYHSVPQKQEEQRRKSIQAYKLYTEDLYLLSMSTTENTPTITVAPTLTPTPTPTEIPTPTPEAPLLKYTTEEIHLLARLIEAEAGIEPYECKVFVGSVVMNRVNCPDFPDTIEEVIYDNKPVRQFSVTKENSKGVAAIDKAASTDSLYAAIEVLSGGSQLPEDVLTFYADYCTNSWNRTRKTHCKSGTTVFTYMYK